MMTKQQIWIISGLILLTGILMFLCIRPGHNWGGDFALYISQTESIINGNPLELFEENKLSVDHSVPGQGPYLYPFGFPLLMVPAYLILGLDLVGLKVFSALFALASIPIFFLLFRTDFKNEALPYLLIIGIVTQHNYLVFTDNILSDFPFILFSFLSFLLMRKANSSAQHIGVGLCIFFSYFIRDVGLFLIPALFVFQGLQFLYHGNPVKDWKVKAIPYLVFATLFILTKLFLPNGGANHIDILISDSSFERILHHLKFYEDLVSSSILTWDTPPFASTLPVIILVFLGLYASYKTTLHYFVFAFLVSFLIIIWPPIQGQRFWYPVMPFLMFYIFQGLIFLSSRFKWNQKIIIGFLSIWMGIILVKGIIQTTKHHQEDTNTVATAEMNSIYEHIQLNIPKNKIVGFAKPRVLRLFTKRNSILVEDHNFKGSIADFLLIKKNDWKNSDLQVHFETDNYILLSR